MIATVRITKDSPLKINFDGDRRFDCRISDSSIIQDDTHGETNEPITATISPSITEIPSLHIKNVQKIIEYPIGRLKA